MSCVIVSAGFFFEFFFFLLSRTLVGRGRGGRRDGRINTPPPPPPPSIRRAPTKVYALPDKNAPQTVAHNAILVIIMMCFSLGATGTRRSRARVTISSLYRPKYRYEDASACTTRTYWPGAAPTTTTRLRFRNVVTRVRYAYGPGRFVRRKRNFQGNRAKHENRKITNAVSPVVVNRSKSIKIDRSARDRNGRKFARCVRFGGNIIGVSPDVVAFVSFGGLEVRIF